MHQNNDFPVRKTLFPEVCPSDCLRDGHVAQFIHIQEAYKFETLHCSSQFFCYSVGNGIRFFCGSDEGSGVIRQTPV
jgi:hypothetical protein